MNRKHFLKNGLAGLGVLTMPNLIKSSSPIPIISSAEGDPALVKKGEGQQLNVLGDTQTHKISGAMTNDLFCEWISEVAPGVGIPPHYHTKEDEVFRILKGSVEFWVDGDTFTASEGDVVFAPRDIPHSWKIVGDVSAKMISSAFPAGIENMFVDLAKLPPGPPDFEKVAGVCKNYGIFFV